MINQLPQMIVAANTLRVPATETPRKHTLAEDCVKQLRKSERGCRALNDFRRLMNRGGFGLDVENLQALGRLIALCQAGGRPEVNDVLNPPRPWRLESSRFESATDANSVLSGQIAAAKRAGFIHQETRWNESKRVKFVFSRGCVGDVDVRVMSPVNLVKWVKGGCK